MSIELSEQEQLRRQSLAALRELGIDPYPAARYEGDGHGSGDRRQLRRGPRQLPGRPHRRPHHVAPHHGQRLVLRITGSHGPHPGLHPPRRRLPRRRPHAIQHGVQETARHRRFSSASRASRSTTNTGELSVHCRKFTVLSKSIRPLPVVRPRTARRSTPSPTPKSATASATSTWW